MDHKSRVFRAKRKYNRKENILIAKCAYNHQYFSI